MLTQTKFCHNAANILFVCNCLMSCVLRISNTLAPATNHNNLISDIMGSDVLRELCKPQDGTVDV